MAEKEITLEIKNPVAALAVIYPIIFLLLLVSVFYLSMFTFLWFLVWIGIFLLTGFISYVLYKTNRINLILFTLLFVFTMFIALTEMQLTFTAPIAFGDEGFHTRMAQYMAQTQDYPVLTPFDSTKLISEGFWRPPAWNLLEGSFYYLFGFNDVIVKFLTPFIATILTSFMVFVLVKRIYNPNIGLMTSVMAVTIPSVVTYAVLFYVDSFFTFYFVAFVLTLILTYETRSRKYSILAGVFGAISFLTKTPGVVVYLIVIMLGLYELLKNRNSFSSVVRLYLPIVLIGLVTIVPFMARGIVYYHNPFCYIDLGIFKQTKCQLNNYTETLQFQGRTTQTGSEVGLLQAGPSNYFDFAYGNVWFLGLAFFAGLLISIYQMKKSDFVILISILTVILVFYQSTDRIEDTARYTLGWAPLIALVAGRYFSDVFDFIKKYQKYLALIVFVFVFVMSIINFSNKMSSMVQVKQFSPLFFQACDWVKSRPDQVPLNATMITVWNYATEYNCQRNTVGSMADISLSTDLNSTLHTALVNGIDFIFVQKFSLSNQALSETYSLNFIQFLESHPSNFVKIYENGPDWSTCIQQGGCDGTAIYRVVR